MECNVREDINQCVEDISEILDLTTTPTVGYSSDVKDFRTPTEMARYNDSDDRILFNETYLNNMGKTFPYIIFSAAKELRHAWQKNYPLDDHKREVDANAFALIITDEIFGVNWDFKRDMEKLYSEEFTDRLKEVAHWFYVS